MWSGLKVAPLISTTTWGAVTQPFLPAREAGKCHLPRRLGPTWILVNTHNPCHTRQDSNHLPKCKKKKKKEIVLAPKANPKYTNVECHMQRDNIFGPNSSVPGGPVSRQGPCNVKQRTPGVTKDSEAPSAEALPSIGSPAQTNPNTKEVQQALDQ